MNYAYITLMTKDRFLPGVLILNESLRRAGCIYPLKCMITEGLSDDTLAVLSQANIETILVDKIPLPEQIMKANMELDSNLALNWEDCLTKIQIFGLTDYDKVIFCDADLLVLKNLDHCFEMPPMTAALDGEYSGLWPMWPHFNSGFVVIEPNEAIKDTILEFAESLNPDEVLNYEGKKYTLADQEILNLFFDNWSKCEKFHLNKYYNIFPPHVDAARNIDVIENAYFVHYVGQKPWNLSTPYRDTTGHRSLFLYCIALGLLRYIQANNYKNIDWSLPEAEDKLNANIFEVSVDELYDVPTAEYFLTKLTKDPQYETYKTIVENNKTCEVAVPLIRNLIDTLRASGDTKYSDFIYLGWYDILEEREYSDYRSLLLTLWNSIKDTFYFQANNPLYIKQDGK